MIILFFFKSIKNFFYKKETNIVIQSFFEKKIDVIGNSHIEKLIKIRRNCFEPLNKKNLYNFIKEEYTRQGKLSSRDYK